ncbi:bifunctional phosphopantothenoylcysteine decarboxylase/phosphopantothenate--cysteine ligase CoaBC [Candidatus Marinamargulisbacteria bacterium SCGC AG-343-D04]|nr:bifunctional phosphopantothenoylcysteine decarboxylase/phosphopantothenate--cysteine ligase CoaBC [Candidatus Marinamargulisbacteria bacterium SCGC AG-343-D04]
MSCHVLYGIAGSIAAYKAPEIVRQLKKSGYSVTCILTKSAEKFVSRFTLENVSEEKCYTDKEFWREQNIHIHLTRKSDILLMAPVTANTVSKCAHGIADNLLLNCFLSFKGPVIMAPAMHAEMFENVAIQDNISLLKDRGVYIAGPIEGELLSQDLGVGRMIEPETLVECLSVARFPALSLKNKKILISSGGTTESLDPVRVITNKSTGQLGKALSNMAHLYSADVTMISAGDVSSIGFKYQIEKTASGMHDALHHSIKSHDVLVMTAAISDFIPEYSEKKIRRKDNALSVSFKASSDILKSLSEQKKERVFIGCCLADEDTLIETAIQKCKEKNCDYIIANTASNFGNSKRDFTVVSKEKELDSYSGVSVQEMAYRILSLV